MTREEQIRQAALKECKSFDIPDKEVRFRGVNSAYGLGFCEGAMWADKTMIDKACEWLKEKNKMCMYELEMILGRNFIEDFKKKMEE